MVLCFASEAGAQTPASFGGNYESLRPEQKRLVDDWFVRFSAVVKKPINPSEAYDNLPLSAKTTFNGVTHALMMTKLTDESGRALAGSAIDLVDKVDGAAGEVLGARGDKQFRIYVQLKPGTSDLLMKSKEFKRSADNTVYHKGYPTSFRTLGTPSIQISLTHDEARADIDVDYRSSKFPAALMNGHLSASNSDVRAGDNDERHNAQWSGLQNWWRNLLGLPVVEPAKVEVDGRVLAQTPGRKEPKPADAIFDFLNSWLVEQKPNEAIAYFSDEAFSCMELGKQSKTDRGMAKFEVLENMVGVNSRLGRVASLGEVSSGVTIPSSRVKQIDQPHRSEFVLYDVREDLAEEFDCRNRLDSRQVSAKAAKSTAFGKYIGAAFQVRDKGKAGSVVATLWRKDGDYWRLISYDIDPEFDRTSIPNANTTSVPVPPLEYVDGDKDMVKAASDFLKLWLEKKDVDKAAQYIGSECLPCVNLYRADDVAAATTEVEQRERLKNGLARVAKETEDSNRLEEAIVAPEVHHEAIKLVKHRDSKAFVIAALPDSMGEATKCDKRDVDGNPDVRGGASGNYGNYYASGLSLKQGQDDPAVLWLVWNRVNGSWKVMSYVLLTP